MKIFYDEARRLFHLRSAGMSYVMQLQKGGVLTHLYWGRGVEDYRVSNPIPFYDRSFSANLYAEDRSFSLDTLPMEYPGYGCGEFRTPAYEVQQENGTTATRLTYVSHRILPGKPPLPGLPAVYITEEGEAMTLEILMRDEAAGLDVTLCYTIFRDADVLCRSVRFLNTGDKKLRLLRAGSMCVDFRDADFDMVTLYGAHINERNIDRRPLSPGIRQVDSKRGASSHQYSPFVAFARKNADEDCGEVYGCSLVYSGGFSAMAEVDQFGFARMAMGINPFNFSWLLSPGEDFCTPEAVMVYSASGFGGMSETYHRLYRERLCRGKFQHALRPVLINNWEATYFDFNEEKLLSIAGKAKELGVELFVLDDGWFGHRDDDNSSLGDWTPDKRKLPDGISGIAEKICALGLRFGLWFEPEMVSVDSCLYRAHPDWCIHLPNREHTYSRNQLVLDFSRGEVRDYIVNAVSKVLSCDKISYVKWDMNRHITDIGSGGLPPERQMELPHRYMLGLYEVLERITSAFPDVLFESCSGGGGRFDAGMLYYMPQTWTSDNTDAMCRLKIQYGTSLCFPPVTMGSHVSVVPNHQVGRVTPFATRGACAMSGSLGYELDVTKLSGDEQRQVTEQITLYKKLRPVIQFGAFHRILSPFAGNEAAWNFVSPDKTRAVLMYFKTLSEPGSRVRILRCKGLDEKKLYKNVSTGEVFGGDELMNAGLTVPLVQEDFTSRMWVFEECAG